MKRINLDNVFNTDKGLLIVMESIKNSKHKVYPYTGNIIKVLNLQQTCMEYNDIILVEKDTNIGAENIAKAFGEMGYQFVPQTYLTKYYNCNEVVFGDTTANIVEYLSKEIESIRTNKFVIRLNLGSIPYRGIMKSIKLSKNKITDYLFDKYGTKDLIYKVCDVRNITPKQAEEYVKSNIHAWAIVLLSNRDINAMKNIEKNIDFVSSRFLEGDLNLFNKNYTKYYTKFMKNSLDSYLAGLKDLGLNIKVVEEDSLNIANNIFESSILNYLQDISYDFIIDRYKSVIPFEILGIEKEIIKSSISVSQNDVHNTYLDETKVEVLKAIIIASNNL